MLWDGNNRSELLFDQCSLLCDIKLGQYREERCYFEVLFEEDRIGHPSRIAILSGTMEWYSIRI